MRLRGRPFRTPLFSPHLYGQALQAADLTIGVMDGYARAITGNRRSYRLFSRARPIRHFLISLTAQLRNLFIAQTGFSLYQKGDLMTVCLTICPSAMPRRKLALICCG